ncbi:MAG TPA: NAD(P)-dependent oxidoreductase [Dehalococcoidia bacterium]|nr:NAD(P)-dependent oxidoreductase [Dehalococcoidia bacterium]
MRVGFIGLGIMGRPMAKHLIAAGHQLTVWNRSRAGIEALVTAGAAEGASPADVASRSDVVITMVGDSPDVEEVALGERGIIHGVGEVFDREARIGDRGPRLVHIDMSTISPEVTRRIASEYARAHIEMLDAPVSGGETGAINATLSIMVGGKREIFERCRPLFEAMGRTVTYCGPIGAGQTVKLCNQVLVSVTNMAVCEALVLAKKAGVSPSVMLEAVSGGAASSWQLLNLAPKMIARDFRPGFKVWHQEKDLRLALEVAREAALPLPATALVSQLFASVHAAGFQDEGTQALVKALEKLGHVTVED